MGAKETPDPWRSGRGAQRRIAACETRLALSASPGADVLLEMLGTTGGAGDAGDLLDQAEAARNQFDLNGSDQTIAVIDSGIAYDHVALGGGFGPGYRVVGGWDFAEGDANPYDDGPAGFHGSHVSGILAGDDGSFQGMAPGADLVALRVFDDQGAGSLDWVEDALQWVHENRNRFEHPITTVNLSVGALIPEHLEAGVQAQLQDELRQLREDGILVFAAAGNRFNADNPERLTYPAASDDVVAVASLKASGDLSSFTQRESGILAADGERVRSSVPDHVLGRDGQIDDYTYASGSSMASPQLAGASVLLREAYADRGITADADDILDQLRETSDVRRDTNTGLEYRQVNLLRAISEIEARDEPDVPGMPSGLPATHDGTPMVAQRLIDLGDVDGQAHTMEPDAIYQVRAERDGVFSWLRDSGASPTGSHLVVTDSTGNELFRGDWNGKQQIDLPVNAGQVLRFGVDGTGFGALRMVNAVELEQGRLDVTGTNASDQLKLDLANGVEVTVNGARYAWADRAVTQISMDLRGANDTLEVNGSAGSERVTLRAGSGEIGQVARTIQFQGAESVHVEGGGGADRGYLYDSTGDDQLELHPGSAKLTGTGFDHDLSGFKRLYAHAINGGEDRALLFDSAGDDELSIRPQFTSLQGSGQYIAAYGFDRVQAYASAGGYDRAELFDSAGNDRLSASAVQAWISGDGYFAQARHFEEVRGFATAGGVDHATLYASNEADTLSRAQDLVQLVSADHRVRAASGFERVETFDSQQAVQTLAIDSLESATQGEAAARLALSPSERRLKAFWQTQSPSVPLPWEVPGFAERERQVLGEVLARGPDVTLPSHR